MSVDRWKNSMLFEDYRHEYFDSKVGDINAWDDVQKFIANDIHRKSRKGITLVGPPGTGKTLMAHEIARAVIANPVKLRAVKFSKYMDNIGELITLAQLGHAEEWLELNTKQKYYEEVKWLLLDDVGTEHQTDSGWALAKLSNLLRERGNACRPTIITTNVLPEDWQDMYGPSTGSYFYQIGQVVRVYSEDERRRM